MAEWKINGLFKADADKVYTEISSLPLITPEEVLKKARNQRTELHRCFEWNDSVAAEKFRLSQARQVIQLLVVTPRKEEKPPVRVFQITSERNVYQENQYFLKNEDEYQILLRRARIELQAFQRRYSTLSELEEIFALIDEL